MLLETLKKILTVMNKELYREGDLLRINNLNFKFFAGT
jgi:hypothetical protein